MAGPRASTEGEPSVSQSGLSGANHTTHDTPQRTSGLQPIAAAFESLEEQGLKIHMQDLTYCTVGSGIEVLGRGSMGIVYKASLRSYNLPGAAESRRVVALKQLLHASDRNRETLHEADQLEGLLRELTIGILLPKTPNICAFIGAVSHPVHGPLLVYEHIDGINMGDYFELQNVKHKAKFRRGKTQQGARVM